MTGIERASDVFKKKAHYAISDEMVVRRNGDGRHGRALCWEPGNPIRVYDQLAIDMDMSPGWRKRKVIEDLPLCKRCAKAAEKHQPST